MNLCPHFIDFSQSFSLCMRSIRVENSFRLRSNWQFGSSQTSSHTLIIKYSGFLSRNFYLARKDRTAKPRNFLQTIKIQLRRKLFFAYYDFMNVFRRTLRHIFHVFTRIFPRATTSDCVVFHTNTRAQQTLFLLVAEHWKSAFGTGKASICRKFHAMF